MAKRKLDDAQPTSKEICEFYYKVTQRDDDGTHHCECSCGVKRKFKLNTGYTNLMSHIKEQHPKHLEEMATVRSGGPRQAVMVSKKSLNLFEWLNFVVMTGLPFSIVENKIMRSYVNYPHIQWPHLLRITHLDPISVDSLMKFLEDMTKYVVGIGMMLSSYPAGLWKVSFDLFCLIPFV